MKKRTLLCLSVVWAILLSSGFARQVDLDLPPVVGVCRATRTMDTTYISGGHITTNTIWSADGNPYIIRGNVEVDSGVVLDIEPGVKVFFERGSSRLFLRCYGTLHAIGTETDSIYFNGLYGAPPTWRAILLESPGGNSSIISHCNFHNALWGVQCEMCSPLIENCTFSGDYYEMGPGPSGIYCVGSSAVIQGCFFTRRDEPYCTLDNGIVINTGSSVSIEDCYFDRICEAIQIYNDTHAEISNCVFWKCNTGVAYRDGSTCIVSGCLVKGNPGSDIGICVVSGTPDSALIWNNTIVGPNNPVGIEGRRYAFAEQLNVIDGRSGLLSISEEFPPYYNNSWGNAYQNFYFAYGPAGSLATVNANGDSCDIYYNISMDPLFVDEDSGDFHITRDSPCIDAGDPSMPWDPDGTPPDIGCFYFDQTGITRESKLPNVFGLEVYPNPFNESITIEYSFPDDDAELEKLTLIEIYSITGKHICSIRAKRRGSVFVAVWDGRDNKGISQPSGVYFVVLRIGTFGYNKKITLVR